MFDHERLPDPPKSYGNSEGGVFHASAEILVKTDHVIGYRKDEESEAEHSQE